MTVAIGSCCHREHEPGQVVAQARAAGADAVALFPDPTDPIGDATGARTALRAVGI